MQLHEFDELNFLADKKVIAFNSKYAQKIMYLNSTSNRKVKVLGLKKHLSVDGKTPSTNAFTSKNNLSISEIYQAKSVILMVKVDNIKGEEIVPLNSFVEANSSSAAAW